MYEGKVFKDFIEEKKISKKKIASDLKMSRTNLYQLFDSVTLSADTKNKLLEHFGVDIFKNAPVDKKEHTTPIAPVPKKDNYSLILDQLRQQAIQLQGMNRKLNEIEQQQI